MSTSRSAPYAMRSGGEQQIGWVVAASARQEMSMTDIAERRSVFFVQHYLWHGQDQAYQVICLMMPHHASICAA